MSDQNRGTGRACPDVDVTTATDMDGRLHNVEHMLVHLHDEGEQQAAVLLGHKEAIEFLANGIADLSRRLDRAEAYGREVHGQLDGALVQNAADRAGLRQDLDRMAATLRKLTGRSDD